MDHAGGMNTPMDRYSAHSLRRPPRRNLSATWHGSARRSGTYARSAPRDMCAGACIAAAYMGLLGSWVGRIPNRFLIVTRWRENLSSGEKRAVRGGRVSLACYTQESGRDVPGWADFVIAPPSVIFCGEGE
jgi:hypothetical protein